MAIFFFFDGRKDMTLVRDKRQTGGRVWRQLKNTSEAGTLPLYHVTLERGTGSAITDRILNAIEVRRITHEMMAVGADSTHVNTGPRGRAIHLLELHSGHPLQWFIWSLHLSKLSFHQLCKTLIGLTEVPTLWKGPSKNAYSICASLQLSVERFPLFRRRLSFRNQCQQIWEMTKLPCTKWWQLLEVEASVTIFCRKSNC